MGTFLPFQITYYLNGHPYIERNCSAARSPSAISSQTPGWRATQIHEAILSAFRLKAENYTLTQLRYDPRKMKAHGLIERDGKRYAYRLTSKGNKTALLFVLFHKCVCGPLANLFNPPHRPQNSNPPPTLRQPIAKQTSLSNTFYNCLPLKL